MVIVQDMFRGIFEGKNIIVTGHTGFKGSWLSVWLTRMGANVVGISLDVPTKPANFTALKLEKIVETHFFDIKDSRKCQDIFDQVEPDFIFHLAAKSLVKSAYLDPTETIATNAVGTTNVLACLKNASKPIVAVMITSDKVYENVEWNWGYRETDRIWGTDPYSASKGMAELAIHTFVKSFFDTPDCFVRVGIGRAGNVIGGGDWALDRVVPDCMSAWSKKDVPQIRKPHATRPWQHVLDPLSGYLRLAEQLSSGSCQQGEAFNFGPDDLDSKSVGQLIQAMAKMWGNNAKYNIKPSSEHAKEAGLLKLACDKANVDLQWKSVLNFEDATRMTVEWYKQFYEGNHDDLYEFTNNQIDAFTELAVRTSQPWAME